MPNSTDPITWLRQREPEFANLQSCELDAIMHFALLWSRFESRKLKKNGNAKAIIRVVKEWNSSGLLKEATFDVWLSYFKERYYQNGSFTHHFCALNLHPQDHKSLVKSVLSNENKDIGDCVAVLLIIIYRLRNNFFHGEKWGYGFEGDYDNFRNANSLLMYVLELREV